eukprot:CAMPEP_0172395322 /NCGR_PEP_ID=MMETSP1061-20121228/18943_1 /TAXON_ID=37318 /ORGANISM="Pseudo-nitzschia pungens, Strain cf. pungens" /LENGTH=293 /DNA_ID=CAMNT_0013126853 /DNA_START=152 /DNA_END=1030 /DNA_ORIENTATION=+
MKISVRPFLLLQTLALIFIVFESNVRVADALIQRRKVLQPGPSSAKWGPNNNSNQEKMVFPRQRILNQVRSPTPQNYNVRHHEQSEKSMRMTMVHGNIGVPVERTSIGRRRIVLATLLTAVLLKPRGVAMLLANGLYKPYQNALVTNPLITKVITGAVLAIAGDAAAQASANTDPYDKRRALSFAVFDSCYRMFQHNMFPAVIRAGKGNVVKGLFPFLAPAAAAIEQTAMYQFLVVPLIYYPVFFTFTGFIQGLTFPQSLARFKAQFFRCWRRNLMFWIPTQMVLFGMIAENW